MFDNIVDFINVILPSTFCRFLNSIKLWIFKFHEERYFFFFCEKNIKEVDTLVEKKKKKKIYKQTNGLFFFLFGKSTKDLLK